jgi:hypothetical protein
MIPTHHAGKFLPKTKSSFLHDFTLMASVVGESVIGHGISGKVSQLKWRDLLKASCWSKQQRSVVTQSHSHSMSDGSEIQVRWHHVLYGIPYVGYPPPHRLKYLMSY